LAGDAVRGLAALGVLVLHCTTMSLVATGHFDLIARPDVAWTDAGMTIVAAGGNGAFLFFALSGYLLSRPFLPPFVDRTPFPAPVRYVRHRLLRVVPAYWVVLTIALLLPAAPAVPAGDVVRAYLLSLHWAESPMSAVLAQAWTLNAEIRFYLLLPLAGAALV